jgi:hypothetical protein
MPYRRANHSCRIGMGMGRLSLSVLVSPERVWTSSPCAPQRVARVIPHTLLSVSDARDRFAGQRLVSGRALHCVIQV